MLFPICLVNKLNERNRLGSAVVRYSCIFDQKVVLENFAKKNEANENVASVSHCAKSHPTSLLRQSQFTKFLARNNKVNQSSTMNVGRSWHCLESFCFDQPVDVKQCKSLLYILMFLTSHVEGSVERVKFKRYGLSI